MPVMTLDDLRARCVAALEEESGGLSLTREQAVDVFLDVAAPTLAAIDRVRDLHHVHWCHIDGHALDRTPTPCVNDGVCSCGKTGCPTIAALEAI
ncbi:hypothetical protein [Streptosporangium vulgare]|uniref:Uncharacterized protein n=1 Tax=Streptosporangium vulgare TaxID=46190 RepID=A0ABV5TQZ1_9ACTN